MARVAFVMEQTLGHVTHARNLASVLPEQPEDPLHRGAGLREDAAADHDQDPPVVVIDLLPTDPIDGVTLFQMDFLDETAPALLTEALGGPADLVMSDMAANTVGHPQTDHLRTMALVEAAILFAEDNLRPGGSFIAKVLAGGADNALVAELKRLFTTVKHAKPPASRKDSSEWYVIAQGFKGERAKGEN